MVFNEIFKPSGSRFDWPLAALFIWALGIVGLAAAWLIGYWRFVRSLPSSLAAEQAWLDQWSQLLVASGVRRSIPLRVTTDLGPMLCRLPRGYELLVPAALWEELEIGQRGAILRHELAHYLRGDVWKSLAIRVLALPHWFNPVSWWAVRRFEEAAEWACDRAATAEAPPTTYAKALIRLGAAAAGPAAYGSAARGPALAVRIRRLVTSHAKEDSTMKKTLLVATGLCLAALSLVRLQLVAKEPDASKEPTVGQPAETRETGIRRDVIARIDGEVIKVLVDHGDFVKKGQVLIKMRNVDLELKIADIRRQLEQTRAHLDAVTKTLGNKDLDADKRKGVEEDQVKNRTQLESLGKELALHELTAQRLNVTSPVDGQVITWQVRDLLMNRAMQKGQILMSLAQPAAEAGEIDNSGSDQNPTIRPDSTEPAKPSSSETVQLQKKLVAEQLGDMMSHRSRIVNDLNRVKLQIMLAEAREKKPDEARLPDAAVENQISQDPHILQATQRLSLDFQQLAEEETKIKHRDDPRLKAMRAKIQKLEQSIEDRKAMMRAQLRKELAADPTKSGAAPTPLPLLEKEKEYLESSLADVEQGIKDLAKRLQEIEKFSAEVAGQRERLAQPVEIAAEPARAEPAKAATAALPREVYELKVASEKMVEQAEKAYEATLAAFEAETATFESVYEWSLRWMSAAESATSEQAQKVAAVQAHLDRMRQLQKKVELLYKVGSKGGEAIKMRAANFYVTEAERRLAQVAVRLVPARAGGTQHLDLQVKIADIQGQLEASEAQLAAINANLVNKNLRPDERNRLQGERLKLEAQKKSLATQLELYPRNFDFYVGPVALAAKTPGQLAIAKQGLRYNGKDFDAWAEELRDDLSPERRREAIQALATFGVNGYGPQAAAQIIEAMRGYSVWEIDGSAEGSLKSAALEAFKKIPRGDALPLVTSALKSDSANERLFALAVLPSLVVREKDALPLYREALKDENLQVRARAMACVGRIEPTLPELLPVLREALATEDQSIITAAIRIAGGGRTASNLGPAQKLPVIPALAPELVGLLSNADDQIRTAAQKALIDFGPEALTTVLQSTNDEEIAKWAEESLQRIRQQQPKQPR